MVGRFNLKDCIEKITLWIEQRNLSISVMIGVATVLWIVANIYFNDLATVGTRVIKQTGKELGSLGLVFTVAACSYYAVRKAYVYGCKKSAVIKQHQSFFSFTILVLRRLHIWFGVLAMTFIVDHGYLMWFVQKNGIFNNQLKTGLIVTVFFCVLGFLGTLIRIYPAMIKFRLAHRYFAFLILIGCLMHIALIR
jgi:hypothetical protein